MDPVHVVYSRFQVLTEGRAAWVEDARGSRFYFDGHCFYRSKRKHATKLVPSWRCPHFGWEHESRCACRQCVGEPLVSRKVA